MEQQRLPTVESMLERHDAAAPMQQYGRRAFARALRRVREEARDRLEGKGGVPPRADELIVRAAADLTSNRQRRLAAVVNATGTVVHPQLGRAPLSGAAREALAAAAGYTTLELGSDGDQIDRGRHVGALAAEACDAEAALVVNNGAAALLLVLAALSGGRETVVSRGELVEIGSAYRLPDLAGASGAVLREVGTTNRTRIGDYRAAIGEQTALLLKVHPASYRVTGTVDTVAAGELTQLARQHSLPFVYDIGTGLLHEHDGALADEPSAAAAIGDGAGLVVFSADKLLGGPQAGIIAGRGDLVLRCSRHPLARALRIDKLQRAALEATLEAHLRADVPLDVPTWAMLETDPDTLKSRAATVARRIGDDARAEPTVSRVGGGLLPGVELPSWAAVVEATDAAELAAALRQLRVVARLEPNRVVLDLRTVPPAHDRLLADLVRRALGREPVGQDG